MRCLWRLCVCVGFEWDTFQWCWPPWWAICSFVLLPLLPPRATDDHSHQFWATMLESYCVYLNILIISATTKWFCGLKDKKDIIRCTILLALQCCVAFGLFSVTRLSLKEPTQRGWGGDILKKKKHAKVIIVAACSSHKASCGRGLHSSASMDLLHKACCLICAGWRGVDLPLMRVSFLS